MSRLCIIDFYHIYYKYKAMYENNRLGRITDGSSDTTLLHYTFRDIRKIVKGEDSDVIVCFDSDKPNNKLSEQDLANIEEIVRVLKSYGYVVLRQDGKEADDLVAYCVSQLKDSYDYISIYSVDYDMLQLVDSKVIARIYKTGKGYIEINRYNFEEVVTELFKTHMYYNTVTVYKCLVGDKSDDIKGIQGFGKVAFRKWYELNKDIIAVEYCNNNDYVKELLINNFEGVKLEHALASLEKVRFKIEDIDFKLNGQLNNRDKIMK